MIDGDIWHATWIVIEMKRTKNSFLSLFKFRPRCLVVSKSSFKITFVYIFLFNLFYMLNFHKFGVVLLKQKPSILSDEAREK